MSRKTSQTTEPTELVDISPAATARIEATQDALAVIEQSYSQDRDLLNQLLGQAQMADAFAKFSVTVTTSKLAYVKENKLYQALKGKQRGDGHQFSGTWEEFCGLLSRSREQVDEDLRNLKALGEEALESMNRMGIGYRQMRQYRKLPEDQQLALLEVAKAGDKGEFLDLAEELIAKHAKEKEASTKEILQLQADKKYATDQQDKERTRAEKAEKTLASGGPRSAPVAERMADFEKQVKTAQEAASAALLEVTKQVKALNDWWLEEMVQQPGYEPGDVVPTPPEVVQLAQKMHDHIERTAASVGSLQRQIWENHGHDIQAARTYVMQPGVIPGHAGQAELE